MPVSLLLVARGANFGGETPFASPRPPLPPVRTSPATRSGSSFPDCVRLTRAPDDPRRERLRVHRFDAIPLVVLGTHIAGVTLVLGAADNDNLSELPVHMLSDGVRNALSMVLDIAFRATVLNPQMKERASAKTSGVVLIDEVDVHLHPSWQQTIIASFTKAFPEIQFVFTTHSPRVLSDVDRRSIRVLKVSETDPTEVLVHTPGYQTDGVSSEEILSRVMRVNPTPVSNEHAEDVSRYAELLAKEALGTRAEEEFLRKIVDHYGEDSLTVQRLRSTRAMYERRARLLQRQAD